MKYIPAIAAAFYLLIAGPWAHAVEPGKLPAETALKIANLEAKRNARAAELQATVLQAERLQRAVQDADTEYRAAIEKERKAGGVDAKCTLEDNQTWKCPDKAESKK